MIGICRRAPLKALRAACFQRSSSTINVEGETILSEGLNQREMREKALAEAISREEEAVAKERALRELKENTVTLIQRLNSIPSHLVQERFSRLQDQLSNLDQTKTRQLDEELEEFLLTNMRVPKSEIQNRPWSMGVLQDSTGDSELALSRKIKTTTNSRYVRHYPNLKPTPDHKPFSSQELFLRHLSHLRHSGKLGSTLSDVYVPKFDVLAPATAEELTISSLMAAGCHLGHAKAMWRPSTQRFIYGEYEGIHLIDLNETLSAVRKAAKVVEGVAAKGGIILYVGTTRNLEQHDALEFAARRSNGYYVSNRWIPGTITNFTEVSKQIAGQQVIEIDFGDIPTNRPLTPEDDSLIKPDLVVLLNPVDNRNCIGECMKLRIPTIGLCDTNMEPSLLTYPIPCNDDSMRASSLIIGVLSKAAEAGLKQRHESFESYKSKQSLDKTESAI